MSNMFILWLESTNAFVKAIRTFFAFFDSLFYNLISILFRAIFNLANFELVGIYEGFEQRIYVILGIFMLFKVTVSLISYLVNPDKISDKEQGVGKIVTRIITVLVMLIALPTFFSLMTELQNNLLPAIPRVIVGTTDTMNGTSASNTANEMSITMLSGFASVRDGCTVPEYSSPAYFVDVVNTICNVNGEKMYAYNYKPGISTIVGALMCYTVFSLCLTVAIRAFKLIILRMIAPIPVISYISPKSSKDGMFSTWTKTLLTTWVELFILLGMIYLVIYIIGYLVQGEFWVTFMNDVGNVDGALDKILLLSFLIVGLLMFAKQAPKFIFDALGIKPKGAFTRMLGLGASALGVSGAVASSLRERNRMDQKNGGRAHRVRNLGASLFSGLAGASAAGNAMLSSDKPTFGVGLDAMSKYNATNLARINAGSTAMGRLKARGQSLFGGQTDYDRMSKEKEAYESVNKALLQYKNTMEKKALEQTDLYTNIEGHMNSKTGAGINYLEFMSHLDGAKNGDKTSVQYFKDHNFENWQAAQVFTDKLKDLQTQQHASKLIQAVESGDSDVLSKMGTEYNDYRLAVDAANDVNLKVDFSTYAIPGASAANGDTVGIKQALGETNIHVTNVVTDKGYKAAKANADATKK